MVKDALLIARSQGGRGIISNDGDIAVLMASLHHQGFAAHNPESLRKLAKALKDAGGKINAFSSAPEDKFVSILESASFSKEIGEKEISQIEARISRLNDMLGLDISIPFPDLANGKTVRFDAPHASQPHPELNIAGVALVIPSLVTNFVRDKVYQMEQGNDIGGYLEWAKSKDFDQLLNVAKNSIIRQKQ